MTPRQFLRLAHYGQNEKMCVFLQNDPCPGANNFVNDSPDAVSASDTDVGVRAGTQVKPWRCS